MEADLQVLGLCRPICGYHLLTGYGYGGKMACLSVLTYIYLSLEAAAPAPDH